MCKAIRAIFLRSMPCVPNWPCRCSRAANWLASSIFNRRALNAFSENDTSLLRLLAARVSASIDNARLHRRVLTQNRTSRILAQLSNEFSSILQIE